jgi:hypothetical protein
MVAGVYFLLECLMAELGRGIQAGILAGLIYGIVYAFTVPFFFEFFAAILHIWTSPPPLGGYYVQLRVNPFVFIVIGPILGLILGLIYALTYNRLPGREIGIGSARARALGYQWTLAEAKGTVLTLIVWVIILLISILTGLPTFVFFSEIEGALTLQIIMTAWALVLFVPFLGRMLGTFWNRFKPKIPPPPGIPPPP